MSSTISYHILTIPSGESRALHRFIRRECFNGSVEVALEVFTAKFNTNLDYIQIHTDLVGDGITVDGGYSRLLSEVINTSTAAQKMSYEPAHIKYVPSHIAALDAAEVWITDTDGNAVSSDIEIRMLISIRNIC